MTSKAVLAPMWLPVDVRRSLSDDNGEFSSSVDLAMSWDLVVLMRIVSSEAEKASLSNEAFSGSQILAAKHHPAKALKIA